MDFLSGYQSGSDEDGNNGMVNDSSKGPSLPKLSAPQLVVYKPVSTALKNSNSNSTNENCTVDIMHAPELGPSNPFVGSLSSKATGNKSKVEEVFVEDHFFNESYQSYLHENNTSSSTQKSDRIKSSNSKGK